MAVDDDIRNTDSPTTTAAPRAPTGYACVIDALAKLEAAKQARHDGARTLTQAERLRIERSCASDLRRAIPVSREVRLFDPVTLSETSVGPPDGGYLHSLVSLDELRRFARERLGLELSGDTGAAALPNAIRYGDLPQWLAARRNDGNSFRSLLDRAVTAENWRRELRTFTNHGALLVRAQDTLMPVDYAYDDAVVLMSDLRSFLETLGMGGLLGATERPEKIGESAVSMHAERAVDDTSDDANDVAAKATASDEDWRRRAREMASSIITRDRSNGLCPSQILIAEEIEREFRREGICGPRGTPLGAAYIKRHALKGISSGQRRSA